MHALVLPALVRLARRRRRGRDFLLPRAVRRAPRRDLALELSHRGRVARLRVPRVTQRALQQPRPLGGVRATPRLGGVRSSGVGASDGVARRRVRGWFETEGPWAERNETETTAGKKSQSHSPRGTARAARTGSRDGDRRESGRASASSRPRKSAISARASASARRGGASASNARSLSRMPWISADARLASRSAAASLSASPAHSGSFHTKRCRGGVQRRQLALKGVAGGD